ncbi:3-deoxy-manno-octulosonate cytidylyltransferase [Metapseudomonas otitidis]|uniref:3-deoxy-manno-octulosonate cytidylyltransferase n=1 Tax=Metapseudomonas otitidis TaxID=319939 RepID=UPI0013F61055|nr:3-deoxy-manno-octulosonate cytidylyltransferase [Pseudomonas otitidis]
MRTVVVIPARFSSTRFPGKPLVQLLNKPMIIWVAELAAQAVGTPNVYVATESVEIAGVVERAGFQAVMTSADALTGTDRLAEAAQSIDAEIYINVQGDEPLVDPEDIVRVGEAKAQMPDFIINGYSWISDDEDPHNVNIPKVITNERDELVYMSRSALPGFKEQKNAPTRYKKQVCIYAFTREELEAFRAYGRKSLLEHSEDIEILRFLEVGKKVRMIETRPGTHAVDVPEDVSKVETLLRGHTERER